MRSQSTRDKVGASRLGIPLDEYQRRRSMNQKRCSHCHKWLLMEAFSPAPSDPSGHAHRCRACGAQYSKARHHRQKKVVARSMGRGLTAEGERFFVAMASWLVRQSDMTAPELEAVLDEIKVWYAMRKETVA